MRLRTPLSLLAVVALAAPLTALAPAASAAAPVRLLTGDAPETSAFPADRFTVPDAAQLTGRRVSLPVPTCTDATRSTCDALRLLNTLDGFDLQPRVFLPFSGDIDVATVTPDTVWVEGAGRRIGLQQLTFDPALDLLAGTTREQLQEQTTYVLVVTRSVRDSSGQPLAQEVRTPFTTMSGTTELDRLRRALDDGSAYSQAGIASRAASFTQGSTTTVFPPTAAETINRLDQRSADPSDPLVPSQVPNLALAGAGCYAFGSFESPQFVRPDATIPPTPTSSTPVALSKARLGFALIVPAGPVPAGGWPTAVYGPGFTRSYFDLLVTSDLNAAAGIATLATNPLGHGYGPESRVSVGLPGLETSFLSYGRGRDLDGDGAISSQEGSQPTKLITSAGEEPSPNSLHGLRGGLIQTAADNMSLVRAVQAGIEVPDCTGSPGATLARTDVKYYGLSFGGIYGTMLMGTDPSVKTGLLNVAGGPVVDIARLSAFRPLLADTLGVSRPSLLNGGPGRDGFTESIPQPHDPPITAPAPRAMEVQRYLAYATWYGRPGGPEPYAPLLRKDPRNGAKSVLYQVAFGDNTVPNTASGNIVRAGDLFDRVTYYRNDQTPTRETNPHGFLADPSVAGRGQAQTQLTAFLRTGEVVDPDGPLPVFEVPIANRDDLQCLHYPHPQTGSPAFPPAAAGPCPPRPADAVVSPPGEPGPSGPPVSPAPGDPAPGDPAPGDPAPGDPAPGDPAPGGSAPGGSAPGGAGPGGAGPGGAGPGGASGPGAGSDGAPAAADAARGTTRGGPLPATGSSGLLPLLGVLALMSGLALLGGVALSRRTG